MSDILAKYFSLNYASGSILSSATLKSNFLSVRFIRDLNYSVPNLPSYITNILLCGDCVDPEKRNLYLFYIDTLYGAAWIIEINIDTRVQTVVYYDKYNAIGFNQLYKFYNARVVHGRLVWTDNFNPMYMMDIERAKKSFFYKIGYGQYPTTVEWSSIVIFGIGQVVSYGNNFYKSLIDNNLNNNPIETTDTAWEMLCLIEDAYYSQKIENFYFEATPPKHPPVVTYHSNAGRKINNLKQTLFQIAYRYVYIDWRKSTFSPASIVPVPQAEEDVATGYAAENISLNNELQIQVNLGGEEVRAVEIVGRSSQDPSTWFLIETINKFEQEERADELSLLINPANIPLHLVIQAPTVTTAQTVVISAMDEVPLPIDVQAPAVSLVTNNVYYVATNGNDNNVGSISSPWRTPQYGINAISPGDYLYIRGGTYGTGYLLGQSGGNYYGIRISNKNGDAGHHYHVSNYPGETVILDGSSFKSRTASNVGIGIYNSSYWDFTGINVANFTQASDNAYPAHPWYESNVHHIVHTLCNSYHCGNGFVLDGTQNYVYFYNCDSYENADRYNAGGQTPGGLCNGFYITPDAAEHIFFEGCRAWNNTDDGWDMFGSNGGYVQFLNCWAFENGWYGTTYGDGDGFKLGPINGPIEAGVQLTLQNCLGIHNLGRNYDQNDGGYATKVNITIFNCVSALAGNMGFQFYHDIGRTTIRNCISYSETRGDVATSVTDHNSWQDGHVVTAADFLSVNVALLKGARQANGDLPVVTAFHLAATSDLVGAGVAIPGVLLDGDGEAWHTPPSIGAFEVV